MSSPEKYQEHRFVISDELRRLRRMSWKVGLRAEWGFHVPGFPGACWRSPLSWTGTCVRLYEILTRRDFFALRFSRILESVALHSPQKSGVSRCYLAGSHSLPIKAGMLSLWADRPRGHRWAPVIGPRAAQTPLLPDRQPVCLSRGTTSRSHPLRCVARP